MNTLLVHQFHDILPGTCIRSVHEETYRAMGDAIDRADALTAETLRGAGDTLRIYNPVSFERTDVLHLKGTFEGIRGALTQPYTDMDGTARTAVSGLKLPAFGSCEILPGPASSAPSPFRMDGDRLVTPFAEIVFDDRGAMQSFVDRRNGRELAAGLPLNTFLLAEDLPADWDNWDVDADLEDKFAPAGKMLSRSVVSDGPVELRIRSVYQLTEKTTVTQDMVFDAASPLITFETRMDWQDDHRFLKAAFDTAVRADGVRSEIQFGCIRRANTRSNSVEKARFETCNHKYSDLSEQNYGAAVLNDSKYGISVRGGSMRLSLHKGGVRPDRGGDRGTHVCRYAFLPHAEGFGAESVVRPAYLFNYLPIEIAGGAELQAPVTVDTPNVIIETVKPCEDTQRAYIVRAYEAVGSYVNARFSFSHPVRALHLCSMLEEEQEELRADGNVAFGPFRIITLKVSY